jgi:hypothetical protein
MTQVRCSVCHRQERWTDDDQVEAVVSEGGARRPSLAPERAAFETWVASLRGELGPIVGSCSACGQPLVADGSHEAAGPLRVELPSEGWLEIGSEGVRGPEGPVPLDEALAEVRRAWPSGFVLSELRPGLAMFQGGLLTFMLAPFVLWLIGIGVVVLFLSNYGTVGPTP